MRRTRRTHRTSRVSQEGIRRCQINETTMPKIPFEVNVQFVQLSVSNQLLTTFTTVSDENSNRLPRMPNMLGIFESWPIGAEDDL